VWKILKPILFFGGNTADLYEDYWVFGTLVPYPWRDTNYMFIYIYLHQAVKKDTSWWGVTEFEQSCQIGTVCPLSTLPSLPPTLLLILIEEEKICGVRLLTLRASSDSPAWWQKTKLLLLTVVMTGGMVHMPQLSLIKRMTGCHLSAGGQSCHGQAHCCAESTSVLLLQLTAASLGSCQRLQHNQLSAPCFAAERVPHCCGSSPPRVCLFWGQSPAGSQEREGLIILGFAIIGASQPVNQS